MNTSFPPGLHPFWFWNCPLDAAQIERQVAALAAGGCKGVFIHPRQGMQVPYLSQAFFALVGEAIDACTRHGITANIYDEFPYPSGMAGGMTCMGHPEHMATVLRHEQQSCEGGPLRWELPAGELLACQAVPLRDGRPCWEETRDLRAQAGSAYANETWFHGGLSDYTEQRYFAHDPLLRIECTLPAGPWLLLAALQCVQRNHKYWDAYADVCDPEAMRRFMDLTHRAYARALGPERMAKLGGCFIDEVQPGWSRRFPALYRARHGEELGPLLPALQREDHPRHREVSDNIRQLKYDCFIEAFEQPLADWCREHSLRYVAEKPLLRIDQLRYVDIPGCDAGHRRAGVAHDQLGNDLRHNTRATASAAQLYGKEGAACEAFHSLGWSAQLEDARLIVDILMLNGIDRIVPHAAFASVHGLRKHDAPPTWSPQRPDWPLFHRLAQRIERISALLGPLHHDADLLVIDPCLPRQVKQGEYYPQGSLLHALSASRREFLIVDRAWLMDHAAADGAIAHGARRIDCLIAPAAKDDEKLEAWLQTFNEAGGTVLRQALPDDRLLPGITLVSGRAADCHQARFLVDGQERFLVVNVGREALQLRAPNGYAPADIGDVLPRCHEDGSFTLAGLAATVLRPAALQAPVPELQLPWPARWRFTPQRVNLLRLNDWHLSIEQEDALRGSGMVQAKPIGDQISDAGIPIAFERRRRFGQAALLQLPSLTATYRCTVQLRDTLSGLHLVMERDGLRGRDWQISIAGQHYGPADCRPFDGHIDDCLAIALPELPAGSYEISIDLDIDRDDDGLLAPLYIGGSCSVDAAQACLATARQEAPFADLDSAGLAHYAGRIDWACDIDLAPPDAEHVDLDLPQLADDAFELSFNEGPWHALPWSPRRLRLAAGELRCGANRLQVRQYTSLGRAFDGERWNAAAHRREQLGVKTATAG